MKNRLLFFASIIVLLFFSLVQTGCGNGNNQKKANIDSTTTVAQKPTMPFKISPYLTKFNKPVAGTVSNWMAPANNATATFGIWSGGIAQTCVAGPSLCIAKAGISSSASADSQTIGVSFQTYISTIGGRAGLCMIICQPNDTNSWINSQLNNYFMSYGVPNNATGLFNPGIFSYGSSTKLDMAITNALGLPPAILNPNTPCGVVVDNTSPGQEYWTIFFYGIYPGNSGSFTMAPAGAGINITSITPYSLNGPNPIFFSTWYANNKTKVGMSIMFNVDTLLKQNPAMSQYFPVQNGQLSTFQLTFTNDFVFPGDAQTVASTGIPGGTVIPAGTTPFNMSPNNTVNWKNPASTGFNGWVTVYIDSVGYPGVGGAPANTTMKKK
jgi:hypothetical protein